MKNALGHFEHKTVLVTGGAKGIGASITERFAQSGAKTVIADVDEEGEAAALRWRQAGREVKFIRCDVSRAADVERTVALVEREFGTVDILVNNAGIFPRSELLETGEAFWDSVIGINLKGAFLACKAVVPGMIRQGGGTIVNIGSLHAARGHDDTLVYAVSKSGIVTLTRNLAHSLAKYKIRVNGVHPGWVASDGELSRLRALGLDADELERSASSMPLGRMQTGDDIAAAVAFLASDWADQITGQMLAVDGGLGLKF